MEYNVWYFLLKCEWKSSKHSHKTDMVDDWPALILIIIILFFNQSQNVSVFFLNLKVSDKLHSVVSSEFVRGFKTRQTSLCDLFSTAELKVMWNCWVKD